MPTTASPIRAGSGPIDRSLVAYAFLAQAPRGHEDLLSGLAQLFRPIAQEHSGERFDPKEFSEYVAARYGLRIHPWAVDNFAPRLEQAGVLQKVQHSSELVEYFYAPIQEQFSEIDEADVTTLLEKFRAFARPLLAENRLTATDSELDTAFLRQLADLNFISILLKPERKQESAGLLRPRLGLKKPTEQIQWEQENEQKAHFDVLSASFILHIHRNDTPAYELLVSLASGALTMEVILDFQQPPQSENLSGLGILLDAPFLMSLLDLHSPSANEFAMAICDELRGKGVRLATFAHCVDELRDNLKAVKASVERGVGFGDTARRLANRAFAAHANNVLKDAEGTLEREEIEIIDVVDTPALYQYFTEGDEGEVYSALGSYRNALARSRDAASIAGVMRLRKGRRTRMSRIGSAAHVFVTENPLLVDHTCAFLRRVRLYSNGEVPPAITDRYLAGLLWVLFGGKTEELAPKLLLANCAAALEPRNDVIRQMHEFLTGMSDQQAEHFRALMTQERAGQHLMQLTLGDPRFLTRDNVSSVLERITATLIENQQRESKETVEQLRADHARAMRQHESRAAELNEQLKATETALAAHTRQLDAHRTAALEDRQRRVAGLASATTRWSKGLYIAVGAAAGVLAGALAWWGSSLQQTDALRYVIVGAAALLAFLGFWKVPSLLFGERVDAYIRNRFDEECRAAGLYSWEKEFDVDLKTGNVMTKTSK